MIDQPASSLPALGESPEKRPTLTLGQRFVLAINDIGYGGEGVGRLGDFVVFVPFVIPGEVVEVEVTELKRRFARARAVNLVTTSPDRVTPRCRYFGECGGCQYQHLDYARQLSAKQKQVADLFQRIGGLSPSLIEPVIPSPQAYGYRNRLMVRSQWDKYRQGLNVGFLRHDNRLVIDVEECAIAEAVLNAQFQHVRAHPPPKGGLKVVLRVMPEEWVVPKDSFFQTNFHLLPKLTETVRSSLQTGGVRHLVDVYCGVGFFALEAADLVESFAGVELDQQAILAARQNAQRRRSFNGDFHVGRAEELLPGLLSGLPPAQTGVVVDPPRAGCAPALLRALRTVQPQQITYISCHPATLARDLNVLCENGVYEIKRVVPLDMFPQTQHIETVVVLRRGAVR